MKKRLLSILLVSAMCLSLFPAVVFAAEKDAYDEFAGVSSIPTETYKDLGFNTGTQELETMAAPGAPTPYGLGTIAMVPIHELATVDVSGTTPRLWVYDVTAQGDDYSLGSPKTSNLSTRSGGEFLALRSTAVDTQGKGKTDVMAVLAMRSLKEDGKNISLLTMHLENTSSGSSSYTELSVIPFKLYPENAGAYMSMAAGNFDGDEYNTQELAVYIPFGGETYSGLIEIYRITRDLKLESVKTLELRDQSQYYFPDNTVAYGNMSYWDWRYQYAQPAVSLETVAQPGDFADDLCVTYSAAIGGSEAVNWNNLAKSGLIINPRVPYDAATGVFFWIDPATAGAKRTGTEQMRFNWKDDYGVSTEIDKDAGKKWEVMGFGSAGAGDIDNNGYSEVVVAGYAFAARDGVMDGDVWIFSDIGFSQNEYLATWFQYDPEANTYYQVDQSANWVSIKPEDYEYVTIADDKEDGIFTNFGDKDMLHQPLEVTCFAERGDGYAESVALGGFICRLDPNTGISGWTPYQTDGLGSATFPSGTIEGLYAIPTTYMHFWNMNGGGRQIRASMVHNRLFTEITASNVAGDINGMEQLTFCYTYKVENHDEYYTFSGVIGQKIPGDSENANENAGFQWFKNWQKNNYSDHEDYEWVDPIWGDEAKKYNHPELYLSDNLMMSAWGNAKPRTAFSASVADTDNDSILMRHSGKPSSYYFSDPHIIAILQAAPYFAELDHDDGYGTDTGGTKIIFSEGNESGVSSGVSVNTSIQAGVTWSWSWFSAKFESTAMTGTYVNRDTVTGSATATARYQSYTTAKNNMVALVMTPYIRYYYEIYDPQTKTWSETEVDIPRQPRATSITTDRYDQVAAQYNATLTAKELEAGLGWEYIEGNVLNNIEGDPSSYGRSTLGRENYLSGSAVGADTPDNFVEVGRGDSLMSQGISVEESSFREYTWGHGRNASLDTTLGFVAFGFSQEIGGTWGNSTSRFSGTEFEGEVLSIPFGYEDKYTFYWNFGTWEDTMTIQGQEQTFPVLGYLVSGVVQPAPSFPVSTSDPMLHVVKNGTNSLELSWANALGKDKKMPTEDLGYVLYRYQHGAYHPLTMISANAAEDGWFTFADRYATPFESFGYAVRPYALLVTEKYLYGPYSNVVDAYTVTNDENRPYVSVIETETTMGKVFEAAVTPATGNVDTPFIQWQVYDRTNGGWLDVDEGHGMTSLMITGSENLAKEYRCRVTQRVDSKIYVVYSDVQFSGYVFVADKSREYQKDGKTVVDYVLVHEDGTVEVVSSSNIRYNTKYVYSYGYDENGQLLLQTDSNTRQRRSITEVEATRAEVNGGNEWAFDDGHEFSIVGNSKVWDVRDLVNYYAKSSAPLLDQPQTASVAKSLPAPIQAVSANPSSASSLSTISLLSGISTPSSFTLTNASPNVISKTLEENDLISYSCSSSDTLRAAFVHGTKEWTEPVYDDSTQPNLTIKWNNDDIIPFYLVLADEQPTTIDGLTKISDDIKTVSCRSGQTVYLILGTPLRASGAGMETLGPIEGDDIFYAYTLYSFTMGSSDLIITLDYAESE